MSRNESPDPSRASRSPRGPGPGRALLFWAVLLATPLALVALAEGAVRLLGAGPADADTHVSLVEDPTFFSRVEIDGEPWWQVSHPEAYRGRKVRFRVHKPAGTLRVFCLGGSASAGWPHPPDEIYSAYLQQALERAFPDRGVEVLNVSAHAYAAYRVRLIFERVLDFEPDALVLYSGNNEFLELRSYLRRWPFLERAASAANHSHLYRLLRLWIAEAFFPENVLSARHREHAAEGLRAKLARSAIRLRSDPEQFAAVKAHYRDTVEAMLREAHARGVPVVLLTVPVNLRDWHPNVSHHDLEGDARERWREAFDAGRGARLSGDPQRAVQQLERALALEPRHAETRFELGRALEDAGDFPAALARFREAADLDFNPFRALSEQNAALRELANRVPGVHLADADAAFLAESAPRAPGFDLFLDYVHPTERGNVVLARTVFRRLVADEVLGAATGETRFHYDGPARERGYDEDRDVRLQQTLLALFVTMHQYRAAVEKARIVLTLEGGDPGLAREVLRVFVPWLDVERRRLVGLPVDPAEEFRAQEALRRYYAREVAAAGRAS